jgi:hypothetical protein
MAGFSMQDEIDFWIGGPGDKSPGQIGQHALFMSLLLVEQPWKKDAANLYSDFERFRKTRRSLDLKVQVAKAIELTMTLRALLMACYDTLVGGRWLGWASPLFVDHLRREGDYFVQALANKEREPAETELCSVLKFSGEHAAFAAGFLLDPTEVKKVHEARVLLGQFLELGDCCKAVKPALIDMSLRREKELDSYFQGLKPKTTKSIIHPLLAAHVVREGKRFVEIIERLRTSDVKGRIAALTAGR